MKIKDIYSGLLAGIIIGLAGMCFVLCKANLVNGLLWGALIFPFGLFIICGLQINLFTGKIGYALDDDNLTFVKLLVMLLANFIGAAIIGFSCKVIFSSDINVMQQISVIADAKTNVSKIKAFVFLLKSMFCGMMIYLAVYLYKLTDNSFLKFVYILIPTFFFVYIGFEHCVANMFYLTFAMRFNLNFVISTIIAILGNSIGSLFLHYMIKTIRQ